MQFRHCALTLTKNRVYHRVGGTSAVFGKSSLKQSKSFRFLLSNQKLARTLIQHSAIRIRHVAKQLLRRKARAQPVSEADFAINLHFFPRLRSKTFLFDNILPIKTDVMIWSFSQRGKMAEDAVTQSHLQEYKVSMSCLSIDQSHSTTRRNPHHKITAMTWLYLMR